MNRSFSLTQNNCLQEPPNTQKASKLIALRPQLFSQTGQTTTSQTKKSNLHHHYKASMATSQLLDLLTPFTTTLLLLLLLLALSLPFLHTLSSPRQPPTTKPPTHVRPEWINFSFLWKIIQAARQAKLMEFFHGEVLKGKVGMTVVQYSWLSWLVPGPRMAVFTNDEANVRFLHAGGFEDW